MTNDAIKQIKRAEENGAQLIVNAKAEAKFRIEKAVEEIEKSKEIAEANFEKIFNARIDVARETAKKISSDRLENAKAEALKIEQRARSKMDSASELVVEEIKSLWQ